MQFYNGKVITTEDGSKSLLHCTLFDAYHSTSGALQESLHIYINSALNRFIEPELPSSITIFEMGLGTGLNMLLTIDFALKHNIKISYYSIELYPLDLKTIFETNFDKLCSKECYDIFIAAHKADWNSKTPIEIHPNFHLTKYCNDLCTFEPLPQNIDVVYYDAFAPDTQPSLWSSEVFSKLYNAMSSNSILVTYSSKGIVKEALRSVGFTVKRLAGVGGKRHIVRATKGDLY